VRRLKRLSLPASHFVLPRRLIAHLGPVLRFNLAALKHDVFAAAGGLILRVTCFHIPIHFKVH
jgi:hypothetical protein